MSLLKEHVQFWNLNKINQNFINPGKQSQWPFSKLQWKFVTSLFSDPKVISQSLMIDISLSLIRQVGRRLSKQKISKTSSSEESQLNWSLLIRWLSNLISKTELLHSSGSLLWTKSDPMASHTDHLWNVKNFDLKFLCQALWLKQLGL